MITVYSDPFCLRSPRTQPQGGQWVAPNECRRRAEFVLDRAAAAWRGVSAPARFGVGPLVHTLGGCG